MPAGQARTDADPVPRRRPARRGCRAGWRVRRAKARRGSDQLTAPGVGESPRRVERQSPVRTRPHLLEPPRLNLQETRSHGADVQNENQHANGPNFNIKSKPRENIVLELLNVQSILPKLPDIRADVCTRSPDFICYTETNLKSATPNRLVSIPGYQLFRQDRSLGRKKSGGGIAVFVKDGMSVNILKVTKNIANSNLESLWVRIKIDKKKAATLVCIYRPPSTNHFQIESDFNDLEDQLQQVIAASTCDRIIIAGDFNADSQTNPAAYWRLNSIVAAPRGRFRKLGSLGISGGASCAIFDAGH